MFLAEFLGFFFSLWNCNLSSSATVICELLLHEENVMEQLVRLSLRINYLQVGFWVVLTHLTLFVFIDSNDFILEMEQLKRYCRY